MPSEFHISAHTERFCHPCEHLHFANAYYGHNFVSGDYQCMHPDAHEWGETPKDPEKAKLFGELIGKLVKHGRQIGKKDRQPGWCPLRRKKSEATDQ